MHLTRLMRTNTGRVCMCVCAFTSASVWESECVCCNAISWFMSANKSFFANHIYTIYSVNARKININIVYTFSIYMVGLYARQHTHRDIIVFYIQPIDLWLHSINRIDTGYDRVAIERRVIEIELSIEQHWTFIWLVCFLCFLFWCIGFNLYVFWMANQSGSNKGWTCSKQTLIALRLIRLPVCLSFYVVLFWFLVVIIMFCVCFMIWCCCFFSFSCVFHFRLSVQYNDSSSWTVDT